MSDLERVEIYLEKMNDTMYSLVEVLSENSEMKLFAALKPRVFIDGNMWCVLYGENLHDGVAGFGETPMEAVCDFSEAWNKPIKSAPAKSEIFDALDEVVSTFPKAEGAANA